MWIVASEKRVLTQLSESVSALSGRAVGCGRLPVRVNRNCNALVQSAARHKVALRRYENVCHPEEER